MPGLVTVVSQEQKKIMLHLIFDHLELKNALVPLMVLSTSHDAGTKAVASHDSICNANGIT